MDLFQRWDGAAHIWGKGAGTHFLGYLKSLTSLTLGLILAEATIMDEA
jgi:hypothetical protein